MEKTITFRNLVNHYKIRTICSVELTHFFIERIKKYDKSLNSFITLCEEQALEQAKQADKKIHSNQASILTGIPLAHKRYLFVLKVSKPVVARKCWIISYHHTTLILSINSIRPA